MTEPRRYGDFADLLDGLKQRSGFSYEWIGRRSNLSRSSVHRYCNGTSLPQDFGTAERIAKVCGATREELAELHRLWTRADAVRDEESTRSAANRSAADETAAHEDPPEAATGPGPPADGRAAPPLSRRRGPALAVGALAAAVAMLAVLSVFTLDDDEPEKTPFRHTEQPQQIAGPTWSQAPKRVPSELFGVTINSSTGSMPTFRVGAVRFWDSNTRWANLEPERGKFDWSILDRLIKGAKSADLPVTFTIGGTPEWASPNGPRTAYEDGSRTAPPNNLKDWDRFVRTLVNRYRGRIQAYELWVNGNSPRFYSGSPETLAKMARRAGSIVKQNDRKAIVVCPSLDKLWTPEGQQALEKFAGLGGYDKCDAAGVKMHLKQASDPPETLVKLAGTMNTAFHKAGVHLRIWNTGTAHEIALQKPLDQETAGNYAVRFFLAGLYGQVERMYFYNWGGTKIPIVLQAEGGPPTQAAQYVEELNRWLRDAKVRSCGHGTLAGLPAGAWQCRFAGPGKQDLRVVWTTSGTKRMAAPPRTKSLRLLDGSVRQTAPGDAVYVTPRPVLIQASAS